ncbi:MAG: HD domain-containing protein [Bacilli bacterium]|nr:HD domain-containing protein [Bacilli bacterium]
MKTKKRIKEDINLAFHSISVGFMLKDMGCDSTLVISGLLHDIIEDSEYDYEYIKTNYGFEIAQNVLKLSEDMNINSWKEKLNLLIIYTMKMRI